MSDETPAIAPADVAQLQADGWMLLDVRTDEEWAEGRIEGATHIPMDQVVARQDEIGEQVICVCAVGGRSERVTQYLVQQGFDAVNLVGGIHGWVGQGRPIVS